MNLFLDGPDAALPLTVFGIAWATLVGMLAADNGASKLHIEPNLDIHLRTRLAG